MYLQSRVALIEADACKAALKQLNQDPIPPAGYNAAQHTQPTAAAANEEGVETDVGPGAAELSDSGVRLPSTSDEQLQRLLVEVNSYRIFTELVACGACYRCPSFA